MSRARLWRRNGGPALLAAVSLAVHMFAASFLAGAHAAPALLDAFGNPLCLGSAAFGQREKEPAAPAPIECCGLGCHVASHAPFVAVDSVALPAVAPVAGWAGLRRAHQAGIARPAVRSRGPPLLL